MTTTGTPPAEDRSTHDGPSTSARILGLPRRWFLTALATLLALLAFAIVWFEPQALFLDDRVDEAFPAADATETGDGGPADNTAVDEAGAAGADGADDDDDADADADADAGSADEATTGPVQLSTGEFAGRNDYSAVGTASVFEVDGERVLRFEDFETDNGPDLVVWLTSAAADADDAAVRGDFIEVGELKGNVGDQNYELSAEVDLDAYDTVVIWCRRFTVGFATAPLT